MNDLLVLAVALLSFANGANDNSKGVATLWGAGLTTYRRAIAWATAFTFLGSLTAIRLGGRLAAKFAGAQLVDTAFVSQIAFLSAVALAAGATVLLAVRLGLPVSTTHALTGALAGAGVTAAGFAHVRFEALGRGILLPLLLSPILAMGLTVGVQLLTARTKRPAGQRDCLCINEAKTTEIAAVNSSMFCVVPSPPFVRWARAADCETGAEIVRFRIADGLHWFSAAAISFARGVNDTPKIVAVLLVAAAASVKVNYLFVAVAITIGAALGAAPVARTLSRKITPMAASEAVVANLVAAALVTIASPFALPVSTTHVTSGGIFGIGVLRRHEADWTKVRDIVLAWVFTLPLGAVLASLVYKLLLVRWF